MRCREAVAREPHPTLTASAMRRECWFREVCPARYPHARPMLPGQLRPVPGAPWMASAKRPGGRCAPVLRWQHFRPVEGRARRASARRRCGHCATLLRPAARSALPMRSALRLASTRMDPIATQKCGSPSAAFGNQSAAQTMRRYRVLTCRLRRAPQRPGFRSARGRWKTVQSGEL